MASILYREGGSHEVNGIKCEVGAFDGADVALMLQSGWFADPADLGKKPALTLPDDKNELERIAREFGVELDKRKKLADLKSQVMELVNVNKD